MDRQLVRYSKFLSLVLRHRPEHIGLTLDNGGWADVNELLHKANAVNVPLTPELLQRVVTENNKQGLRPRQRHHVHLSGDGETAVTVGQRHGTAVLLIIQAGQMHQDGYAFYRSANGVWLTDHVPPAYIQSP